ncbi:TetR/AcrR family transcriptional regulator [Priestia koreensis]|uniref:TetR/AcrR family transcriptional regulator n=1 Tax=Priestia koreensis TaxID=284581 RepID=UPI0006A94F2F|nr:TetR/AcrR family transcriptional regulator [Priestia koreensis]
MVKGKRSSQSGAENGIETRKVIIKTARALFMEYGYRAVSTRKIAESCGITQPALYHHFPNKQSIYLEMLRNDLLEMKTSLQHIVQSCDEMKESLARIIYFLLERYPFNLHQLFHDIEHEVAEEHHETIQEWWRSACQRPIASLFEEGIKKGAIYSEGNNKIDAERYSFLLMNVLGQRDQRPCSRKELSERATFLATFILYGVSSESRPTPNNES